MPYLLGLWGLPEGIVNAVARHHTPAVKADDDPGFGAPAAVCIANWLACEAAHGGCGQGPCIDQEYLRAVGVEDEIADWRAMSLTVEVT